MQQAKKGVEVIEIRFAVQNEISVHKVFARNKGQTIREVVEPICELKSIDIDSLGVYLDLERSAELPLHYDLYSLKGHVLHVIDYKAPILSIDEVDGKLFSSRRKIAEKKANSTPATQRKPAAAATRVPSFASNNTASTVSGPTKTKTPVIGRKSGIGKSSSSAGSEMYPQRLSTGGSAPLARNTSAGAMLSQPGGRRPRPSEVVPPMNITSKLLGLSEGSHHKKEHTYEDDNGNEKHRKQMSLPSDDFHSNGDVSPGGTLHKNRSSAAKLSVFSLQPQNSKSHSHYAAGASISPQQLLEKEKMDILVDLLEQWGKSGLPEMPPLAGIGLPKFESSTFEIEDHWTNFIDKTDLTQRQKDQQEALWELLYTESEYIRALYVIHDLFMCCLLNMQSGGVLNDIELEMMFSNVTELATTNSDFWSNELIGVLEHSRKHGCLFNPSLLKPAFTNFGEKFMPYTKYCIDQKRCSDYVKKNYQDQSMFRAFVVWAEAQKQCNRLKLHDLLVKPMQRMTRYGLLLRAIHKKTDEEDVKQDLMDMIKNVDKFVTAVDQTLTRTDEKEKLIQTAARIEPYEAIEAPLVDSESSKILAQNYMSLDLLSPMTGCGKQLRYNLLEGPLRLRDMNNKTDVHCILFTDMLLFTKRSKQDKLRIIKPPIRIDCLSIHEMKENPHLLLVHLTDFGVAQAAYTLHGDNIGKWAKTFKKAQTLYMKCKEQARKESEHMSITDFDMDDIGFSGPLVQKASGDAVFNDYVDTDFTVPNAHPQSPESSQRVQRVSSFSSLNGTEGEETETNGSGSAIPQSVSSPDIGRRHNTLPPRIKVHRKSSSSSGESASGSSVNGERRKLADRRRRVGASERYLTAEAVMNAQDHASDTTSKSDDDGLSQRVAWQVGGSIDQATNDDSDDEFEMSAQLNANVSRPSSGRKVNSVLPPSGFSREHTDTVTSLTSGQNHTKDQNKSLANMSKGLEHLQHSNSARSLPESSTQDSSKSSSRKISQMDILRLKKFQDFLNDSSL